MGSNPTADITEGLYILCDLLAFTCALHSARVDIQSHSLVTGPGAEHRRRMPAAREEPQRATPLNERTARGGVSYYDSVSLATHSAVRAARVSVHGRLGKCARPRVSFGLGPSPKGSAITQRRAQARTWRARWAHRPRAQSRHRKKRRR